MSHSLRSRLRPLAGAVAVAAACVAAAAPSHAAPAPPVQPICPAPQSPFTDLDPGSVHTPNVICAGQIGILNGGPGGAPPSTFGPLLTTTRGQLATLIVNLIERYDMELNTPAPNRFNDDDGHTHEASFDHLAVLDVIGPDLAPGFEIQPDLAATRGVIADLMKGTWLLVVGDDLPPGPDAFTDDDGSPFEDEINALAAAGIIAGKAPGIFDPDASVTREQIATMFVQFLEKAADAMAAT